MNTFKHMPVEPDYMQGPNPDEPAYQLHWVHFLKVFLLEPSGPMFLAIWFPTMQ